MYFIFNPIKDATIYESRSLQNTGIDSVLEIKKDIVTFTSSSIFNSRIVLDFDYNFINNQLSRYGTSIFESTEFLLKLYTVDAQKLHNKFSLHTVPLIAFPYAQVGAAIPWTQGTGMRHDKPELRNGISWQFSDGLISGSHWWPSSASLAEYSISSVSAFNMTGSFNAVSGGGLWPTDYTNSSSSLQTYEVDTVDLELDIKAIIDYSIINIGIGYFSHLIKRLDQEENSTVDYGAIQFYSKDTHTIYAPIVRIGVSDYSSSIAGYTTGSLNVLSNINLEELIIHVPQSGKHFKNINTLQSDSTGSLLRIDVRPRLKYPQQTFTTSSIYSKINVFQPPTTGQYRYSIYDKITDEQIIPPTICSLISCDSNGMFVTINPWTLPVNRWYKIVFHINGKTFDEDYIFKIEL